MALPHFNLWIEFAELTGSDREIIEIGGRFATSFLARRIVWGTEILSGDLGMAIGQLIFRNLTNPGNPARKIDGIAHTPYILGETVDTQTSYRNLMAAVTGLCDAADVGIKTIFDPRTGLFTIAVYHGSVSQAVFSREFENIIEQKFTQSAMDYASFALVAGKGEGVGRVIVPVGGGAGEGRYEIYVDARDLREEDFPNTYEDALSFRGLQRLAELAGLEKRIKRRDSFLKDYEIRIEINAYPKIKYDVDECVTAYLGEETYQYCKDIPRKKAKLRQES